MAVPPTSTLDTIKQKVRRLTRSPNLNLLSEVDLEQYINTFVVYDFPEILRTFKLRTDFSFYTNPGQDEYPTSIAAFGGATNAATNPLYNFQNIYLTVHPPVYAAGFPCMYSQDRQQFYNYYPLINSIASIGVTGNGVLAAFSGIINAAQSTLPVGVNQQIYLLQNNVLFSSVDINGNGLAMVDVPLLDSISGMPTIYGQLYRPNNLPAAPKLIVAPYTFGGGATQINPANFVNYRTGQFTVTFDNPPAAGSTINSQTIPQSPSLPRSVLYYANKFVVRPIPDQSYKIDFEVWKRPTALLADNQSPELEEYWQYIAYGAAIKVLQDRSEIDMVNELMPEFKRQESLCNNRTIVQLSNERSSTIYSDQSQFSGGNGNNWWGGGFF